MAADDIAAIRSPSPELRRPINERVLGYLNGMSAHSDIADVLTAATKPLGDVQVFCPNPSGYGYVLVSTNNVAFGFAAGQHTIAFRLDEKMKTRALATGGLALPECGADWVAVVHRRPDSDWPTVDVRFWALKAYVHARSFTDRS
jgi:hypothetical protein